MKNSKVSNLTLYSCNNFAFNLNKYFSIRNLINEDDKTYRFACFLIYLLKRLCKNSSKFSSYINRSES
jgi:hypothetical protein